MGDLIEKVLLFRFADAFSLDYKWEITVSCRKNIINSISLKFHVRRRKMKFDWGASKITRKYLTKKYRFLASKLSDKC